MKKEWKNNGGKMLKNGKKNEGKNIKRWIV